MNFPFIHNFLLDCSAFSFILWHGGKTKNCSQIIRCSVCILWTIQTYFLLILVMCIVIAIASSSSTSALHFLLHRYLWVGTGRSTWQLHHFTQIWAYEGIAATYTFLHIFCPLHRSKFGNRDLMHESHSCKTFVRRGVLIASFEKKNLVEFIKFVIKNTGSAVNQFNFMSINVK